MPYWIVEVEPEVYEQWADEPGTMGHPLGIRFQLLDHVMDFSVEEYDWDTHQIVPRLEECRSKFLAQIDNERTTRSAQLLTAGQSVQYAYTVKAAELYNYDVLLAALVPTMTPEQLAYTFPWVCGEAAKLEVTLGEAMTRVRNARAQADSTLRAIEAKAQAAKVGVREAETLEQMEAAAAVNWDE